MIFDLWPFVAAGAFNVVLGFIWYNPKVFGTAWMQMAGATPEMMERGKKRMPLSTGVAFLASVLIAYVMSYFAYAWGVFDWVGALELGFWCWAGFTAPVLLGSVLWEMKPVKYYLINAGFWLVSFMGIALILIQ